jgi:16S rRNA (uracil1498-N3)-methyltransferase
MRIPRIHTGQVLQAHTTLDLEAGPSQHVARALRMGPGDELVLFDGSGGEYSAVIAAVDKGKRVQVNTGALRQTELESPLQIHLGIAVSRGERMEWVVQKATELGVSTISPLLSHRSEVKLKGERAQRKIDHWQQIAISACEQCGRNRLPAVTPLQGVAQWLASTQAQRRFVLHHRADAIDWCRDKPDSAALLIGPEGGLSTEEIAAAEHAGYQSLRLGPRVLRTETAPLAALAILQAQWGDML